LVQIFFDIALPFYKKYSNLLVIDSLFNDPPYNEMPVLVQRTGGDRCMKGLIMAKLVERENYFELVKSFDDFIDNNRNFLFQYNTVKKYLTNHNIG
jgi:hypothetical protein